MGDGLDRLLEGRRLSPVQRRIAHYLAENLTEAIFLSSVELAERAGVSQPSVTRFAMGLGFAGYPELRQALRPLVIGGEVAPEPGVRHEGARRMAEAVDDELRNLTAVRNRLNGRPAADSDGHGGEGGGLAERLTELGGALAASQPLPVLGLRVSEGLATTFGYYARRIHPDVRLLTHGGSELADGLHAARRAGAEWLVAVVLPRYPAEAVQALRYADRLGLRIAVISDRPAVPFPAQVVLDAPVSDRLVFDSHAAPLALAMLLVEAMADAAPLRTRARLEELERMTEETGAFHHGAAEN
ncbi:DNA-binding MurR/RpiR family transcriptional regulator [Thermocatellispora tengchongensis]|uniref:DNA-binding MurR/RpiR family transcriptional regulator n=1 Tax=Thermocatellispora tengchongensis TaxID=1073253 RepID=A0A840PA24_9ACTN|nr:MurR/RpiR family transcriptional regulator [Thermocatellispora tengchongensis]MBB5138234.1 DNA-binding MurR/RpiR family transcriptional regulator [Thermocatellispora tengchongensis]